MENKKRLYWNCIHCGHTWEDEETKRYNNCPKCHGTFVLDWILEENQEQDD